MTVFDPPPAATGARQPRRSPLMRNRMRRSSKETPVMAKDLRAGISTVLAVAFIPSDPTYTSNLIPPASSAIGVSRKVVPEVIVLSSPEGRRIEKAMVTEVHEASESTGRMSRAPGSRITSAMDGLTAGGGGASISGGLWSTLLSKVRLFAFLMDQLSEVHPYAKLAWQMIGAAYKIFAAQKSRDENIDNLLETMIEASDMVHEYMTLHGVSTLAPIFVKIMQQTTECAYFIKAYARRIDFVLSTKVLVLRIWNEVKSIATEIILNDLPYAGGARHDISGCTLNITNPIFQNIVEWANDDSASTILLVTGDQDIGTSTIANDIANWFESLERLGSSFFFHHLSCRDRTSHKLFSTIARDLADFEPQWKARLYEAVKEKRAIRTTSTPLEQFNKFILEPSRDLEIIGPILIVVDALDQCGPADARQKVISVLAEQAKDLPRNIRILITGRREPDIQRLGTLAHVKCIVTSEVGASPDVNAFANDPKCDSLDDSHNQMSFGREPPVGKIDVVPQYAHTAANFNKEPSNPFHKVQTIASVSPIHFRVLSQTGRSPNSIPMRSFLVLPVRAKLLDATILNNYSALITEIFVLEDAVTPLVSLSYNVDLDSIPSAFSSTIRWFKHTLSHGDVGFVNTDGVTVVGILARAYALPLSLRSEFLASPHGTIRWWWFKLSNWVWSCIGHMDRVAHLTYTLIVVISFSAAGTQIISALFSCTFCHWYRSRNVADSRAICGYITHSAAFAREHVDIADELPQGARGGQTITAGGTILSLGTLAHPLYFIIPSMEALHFALQTNGDRTQRSNMANTEDTPTRALNLFQRHPLARDGWTVIVEEVRSFTHHLIEVIEKNSRHRDSGRDDGVDQASDSATSRSRISWWRHVYNRLLKADLDLEVAPEDQASPPAPDLCDDSDAHRPTLTVRVDNINIVKPIPHLLVTHDLLPPVLPRDPQDDILTDSTPSPRSDSATGHLRHFWRSVDAIGVSTSANFSRVPEIGEISSLRRVRSRQHNEGGALSHMGDGHDSPLVLVFPSVSSARAHTPGPVPIFEHPQQSGEASILSTSTNFPHHHPGSSISSLRKRKIHLVSD
ncbi:hypothetical protein HWV62_37701 [Athelia sp. TMB]|nr:hypothetical protein HWV62_37701 [Athelia sp. TMB]